MAIKVLVRIRGSRPVVRTASCESALERLICKLTARYGQGAVTIQVQEVRK